MLVLSRRQRESIVIDNDTTVTVLEIRANRVRLGITSIRGATVLRSEILASIGSPRPGAGEGIPAGADISPPERLTIE